MVEEEETLRFSSNSISDCDLSSADRKRMTGPTRRSTKGIWTEQKDHILAHAVQKFNGRNWKKIAEYVTGTTDVQCLHRWQKVLDPSLIKGPWTKEEDALIIELVGRQGNKKWAEVAKHLPGRIGKQCRERWHNHLNPAINKAPWTQEEELILIKEHQKYGNKWAEIAKILPGRTENSIKNHWNCSLKKRLDLNEAAFHLPGSMARETENGATQAVKQSPGATLSLDNKIEPWSSADAHLDLALGNSSGRKIHEELFRKVNSRILKEVATRPMKTPFWIILDKKEAPDCDLASGQCKDGAVRDQHGKANKLKESYTTDQLTTWHLAKPGDGSPLVPHSVCITPSSDSPMVKIGSNGETNVLTHSLDLSVAARGSLQAPSRISEKLSNKSMGTIDSGYIGQSKTHEVNGTDKDSENCLNLEDKNLGGLCYEPPDLEGLTIFFPCDTFLRPDSYIQQSSSPVSSSILASREKENSVCCSSPESILRSAARSYKHPPSIMRKRSRTPVDMSNNIDGTGTEGTFPKGKQLFLSPLKSQKLDMSSVVKLLEKRLESAFDEEQD